MFFGSKPNAVIYLRPNGLTLYTAAGQSAELAFTSDTVEYLEVLDGAKLAELITKFIAQQPGAAKLRAICLLDDFVVFQKLLPLKGTDPKQATMDFESKLPFDPEDRGLLTLQTKDQLVLLGTNKDFYRAVALALTNAGCKVVSICPAVIYGANKQAALTREAVQKILSASGLAERANFLNKEQSLLT